MIWYFPALLREFHEMRNSHLVELIRDDKYKANGFIEIKKHDQLGRIGFEFI